MNKGIGILSSCTACIPRPWNNYSIDIIDGSINSHPFKKRCLRKGSPLVSTILLQLDSTYICTHKCYLNNIFSISNIYICTQMHKHTLLVVTHSRLRREAEEAIASNPQFFYPKRAPKYTVYIWFKKWVLIALSNIFLVVWQFKFFGCFRC